MQSGGPTAPTRLDSREAHSPLRHYSDVPNGRAPGRCDREALRRAAGAAKLEGEHPSGKRTDPRPNSPDRLASHPAAIEARSGSGRRAAFFRGRTMRGRIVAQLVLAALATGCGGATLQEFTAPDGRYRVTF